jgi:hypothetical protein
VLFEAIRSLIKARLYSIVMVKLTPQRSRALIEAARRYLRDGELSLYQTELVLAAEYRVSRRTVRRRLFPRQTGACRLVGKNRAHGNGNALTTVRETAIDSPHTSVGARIGRIRSAFVNTNRFTTGSAIGWRTLQIPFTWAARRSRTTRSVRGSVVIMGS